MRCPKCGYISFDHLTACGNCSASLEKTLDQLQGTTNRAETPYFLAALISGEAATGLADLGGIGFAAPSPVAAQEEEETLIELSVPELVPPPAEQPRAEAMSLDEGEGVFMPEAPEKSPMAALAEDMPSDDEDVVDLSAFLGQEDDSDLNLEEAGEEDADTGTTELDFSLDDLSLSLEEEERGRNSDQDDQFDLVLDDGKPSAKK